MSKGHPPHIGPRILGDRRHGVETARQCAEKGLVTRKTRHPMVIGRAQDRDEHHIDRHEKQTAAQGAEF